jgi:hypothetical protein
VHGGDVEQVEAAADVALGLGGGVAEGDRRLAQHERGDVQIAQVRMRCLATRFAKVRARSDVSM